MKKLPKKFHKKLKLGRHGFIADCTCRKCKANYRRWVYTNIHDRNMQSYLLKDEIE